MVIGMDFLRKHPQVRLLFKNPNTLGAVRVTRVGLPTLGMVLYKLCAQRVHSVRYAPNGQDAAALEQSKMRCRCLWHSVIGCNCIGAGVLHVVWRVTSPHFWSIY